MVSRRSFNDSKSPGLFFSIQADLNNAVSLNSLHSSLFSSPTLPIPNTPIIIGITDIIITSSVNSNSSNGGGSDEKINNILNLICKNMRVSVYFNK